MFSFHRLNKKPYNGNHLYIETTGYSVQMEFLSKSKRDKRKHLGMLAACVPAGAEHQFQFRIHETSHVVTSYD